MQTGFPRRIPGSVFPHFNFTTYTLTFIFTHLPTHLPRIPNHQSQKTCNQNVPLTR